tara:strand:+ start:52 stop:492 length:441 start_codon:yes stop_codon:yes gene_type:complete
MRWFNKIDPNQEETLYMGLFDIIEPSIDWLQTKANEAAECGLDSMYEKYVEAGNMLLLAIPYFHIVKQRYEMLSYNPCDDAYDETIACMLDRMRCVSAGINRNLVTPFEEMIEFAKVGKEYKENKCEVKTIGDYSTEDYKDSFYKV